MAVYFGNTAPVLAHQAEVKPMVPTPSDFRAIRPLCERLNAGAESQTFTEHAIRHYVRNRTKNGLAPACRRLGKKILISESGFLAWLEGKA